MTREKIKNLIKKSIKELQKEGVFTKFHMPEIKINKPEKKIYGDYATNIAMVIAKSFKKDPVKIASIISSKIKNQKSELINNVEVIKPGFINFFLSPDYLQMQVRDILKRGETFGELNIGKHQKTQVEFISANPVGPLHIGNGRGAFFGDCLSNVLRKAGYDVLREYYVNDAKFNTQIKLLGQTALGKGTTYLNDYLKLKIQKLRKKLKKISDFGKSGHLLAQEIQKDNKNFIEKKLKIKFDNWVFEEDLYKKNKIKKTLIYLENKGLVYEKEGAKWLKISEYGAPKDEVIIRKSGEPSYFFSDIVYHQDKFKRGFKKIIDIWGADHQGHVPKIKAIAKILEYKGQLDILLCQIIRLKGGIKLSKRKGQIITLEQLINEIGLDAARFFYLAKSLSAQMEFDLELAKEQSEKNPVYYIQYAHARICAILRKCKMQNTKIKIKMKNTKLLEHQSELELIKQLIRFPEIIEDAVKDYQLQRIPQYALEVAAAFHQFYRDCQVLTENRLLSKARLGLVLATQIVLKNTLDLMGISSPEKM